MRFSPEIKLIFEVLSFSIYLKIEQRAWLHKDNEKTIISESKHKFYGPLRSSGADS